ncbi:DUF4352 domain-containing protein [Desulfosporosinus sp. Sb-LF]|uniref:DUF4352 domain-containing protein n=1 Tax=Desulfosporosinus sp. Sb-LF TaxID=2560027 RepID=UPI00107F99ED|nr:DUF4352 domain-containing protein [Desulfosporosinus sp. Sb-LF]TGE34475.1 DUF4352 domain-containing protein [Desulfosporosinus sp. Sb-LF]
MSKKKIFALGVAFVMVYAIGWSMGNTSAINNMDRVIPGKGSPSSVSLSNPVGVPAITQEIKQVDFGQVSELGQFDFKVLSLENTKEAKTPTKSISTTPNNYEIIKMEVVNKRNIPADLKDFKLKLLDQDKKISYDLNSDVSISMNSTLEIYDRKPAVFLFDDMNPNLKNEFTAVFEVPSNANYALIIIYKNDVLFFKLK